MFGTAQSDARGAEPAGAGGVVGGVGIGAHAEPAGLIRVGDDPVHRVDQGISPVRDQRPLEVLDNRRRHHRHLAEVDRARRPVNRDHVPFADDDAARRDRAAGPGVDIDLLGPAHAGPAHAAGHHGGMGGLPATRCQHAARGDHAVEVVGGGLPAHQDHRCTGGGELHGPVRVEDHLTDGRSG